MKDINEVLFDIKQEYEGSIKTSCFAGGNYENGNKAKEALIRSQRLINYLHEYVKNSFAKEGVNPEKIFPPLGCCNPELKLEGFLKTKNQDVCICPSIEDYQRGVDIHKILTVNVRSQLSSLSKNIDTLYERTFAEAFNLHKKFKDQCLGEVYLIPTHEYDDIAMLKQEIKFKKFSKLEDYIDKFQAINGRVDIEIDEYAYERVCLLIVDFRQARPKLYSNTQELIADGLISSDSKSNMTKLGVEGFAKDLLELYSDRFDISKITR